MLFSAPHCHSGFFSIIFYNFFLRVINVSKIEKNVWSSIHFWGGPVFLRGPVFWHMLYRLDKAACEGPQESPELVADRKRKGEITRGRAEEG
jgi:hypothetical protein